MPASEGGTLKRRRATNVPHGDHINNNNHSDISSPKTKRHKKDTTTAVNGDTLKVSHPSHGCEVGRVMTLGEGDTGQLGLGEDVMERTKPGLVDIPEGVIQVVAGGMHTVCLTEDGQVYTFGCNDEGALGRRTKEEEECMEPHKVELKEKIVQISAGDSHTAALTELGDVLAWGVFRDANGPIGLLPDGSKSDLPVDLLKGHTVVKIVSGVDHLACLTQDGRIFTLGCAEQGQLGRVAECFSGRGGRKGISLLLTPAEVHCKRRSARFCDVWAGAYVTYAKAHSTGDIYSWGLNNYFQLGFDDMVNRFVPAKCPAFKKELDWKDMSGGQHHTLALDGQGQVYSLGRKEYGRLGLGEDVSEKSEPTRITCLNGTKCVRINAGNAVSFAVAENGTLYAWGMGTSKQLGQSEEDDVYEPAVITGKQLENRHGLMVSAGGQHTVLLAKDKS